MAAWTMKQHIVNAILWATIGGIVSKPQLSGLPAPVNSVPKPVIMAGLALIYSYGTDYVDFLMQ